MIQLDEHFKLINSPQNSLFNLHHNHSDSDLLSLSTEKSANKFTLETDDNDDEILSSINDNLKLNNGGKLKKMETSPAFSNVIKHQLLDLVELWRVEPRPPYASEVNQRFLLNNYKLEKYLLINIFFL